MLAQRTFNILYAAAFAASAILCLSTAVLAQSAPPATDAPAFSIACARADLDLTIRIEQLEDSDIGGTAALVDAGSLLYQARTVCETGDVVSALTIYSSAIRELDTVYADRGRAPTALRAERAK